MVRNCHNGLFPLEAQGKQPAPVESLFKLHGLRMKKLGHIHEGGHRRSPIRQWARKSGQVQNIQARLPGCQVKPGLLTKDLVPDRGDMHLGAQTHQLRAWFSPKEPDIFVVLINL
jgi:hypothetical protein